ncbi:MAG: transposase, partial [Clostridia bacterium]|nr:transposase [Clostridia bacterium]
MVVTKGIELRLDPTKAQAVFFNKCIGAERVAYNAMLNTKIVLYRDYGVKNFHPNWSSLKDFYPWMKEVDSRCLNYAKIEVETAFKNWFRSLKNGGNIGFPKFKKKAHTGTYHNTSMPSTHDRLFKDNKIFIPVIKWVKFRKYKNLDLTRIKKIRNLTIKRTNTGKYFVSVCCDVEIQEYTHTGSCVGLDLGVKDLIITSSGEKFENKHLLKNSEKRIKHLHKVLSKKSKGSKNREKARLKLATAYEKLGNKRKDYLHKLTTKLVRENDIICIEDLNVSGMLKNHSLAKSVADCSFYTIKQMLSYKCGWYGRKLIVIDRWSPTSKCCNH